MTTRGVGLCAVAGGAVLAVVRPSVPGGQPIRLVGLATVRWPASPAQRAHRRVLATARRRLGLPRWCEVAVVYGDAAGPVSPALLASAGLVQGRVVDAPHAQQLRSTVDLSIVEPLQQASTGSATGLAIGAALAAFDRSEPVATQKIDDGEWQAAPGPAAGWAVQPMGETNV